MATPASLAAQQLLNASAPVIGGPGYAPSAISTNVIDPNAGLPQSLPNAPVVPPVNIGAIPAGPIIQRLPDTQLALARKYAPGNPYAALPANVLGPLQAVDAQRAAQGVQPLSAPESALAIQSVQQKKAATPDKERSLWDLPGNALSDLGQIVTSIPRLPIGLYHELQRIPDLPADLAKVHSLKDLTRLPLVDLIPGAYTAGNLSQGWSGIKTAIEHPLMTTLDVTPGASKLAELTPAAKLAEEVAQTNIAGGESALLNRVNPLTTALSKKVVADPITGEPVLANRALGTATQMLKDTRAGQAWDAAFGPRARVLSQFKARGDAELFNRVHANTANPSDLDQIAADSLKLGQPGGAHEAYGLNTAQSVDVTNRLKLEGTGAISSMAPQEQAYAQSYIERRQQLDQFALENGWLAQRGDEIYSPADAKLIDARKANFTRAHAAVQDKFGDLIGKYVKPAEMSMTDWRTTLQLHDNDVRQVLADPNVTTREIPTNLQPLYDTYHAYLDDPATTTAKDLRKSVTGLSQGRTALGATSRTVKVGTALADTEAPVTSLSEFQNFRGKVVRLSNAEKNAAITGIAPARYQPALAAAAAKNYIEYRFSDPADIATATDLAKKGMLDQMIGYSATRIVEDGVKTKGLLDFMDEIEPTWLKMKDEGFDPVYVHSVNAQSSQQAFFPKVSEIPRTPAAVKRRTLDMTPTYGDANLAMANEAVDYIKHGVTQSVVDNVANMVSVPAEQVRAEFADRARIESLRNPNATEAEHLNRLMRSKYQPYDPNSLFNTDRLTMTGAPNTWIRNVDAKVISGMFQPKSYNIFSATEPLTGLMRTSLLPLSPRWHLYNVIGGGIMAAASGSAGIFSHAPQAWKLVSAMMRGEDTALPAELVNSLGGIKRDAAEMSFRSGRTIRRMIDSIRGVEESPEAALAHGEQAGIPQTGLVAGAKTGFNKFVQGSFDLNQRFDDFYRVMGYLDGYDTSGAIKGMSEEGRIQYGLSQANGVLQDMTQMTPFESNVLRQVFPFYAFYQHILRYAMKYPIDHPLRVATTAAIARNEVDRLGGLPTSFLEAFTWGSPDAQGNQKGISLSGLNPFSDVANLFTVAGWLGATNPAVKTLIQAAGIDAQNGGPELYPTLQYDPETGKLTNETANPLLNLIQNTIPQTQIIGNLIGASDQFKKQLRTDPRGAAQTLASEGGLPILLKNYNLPTARINAELNRERAATLAKSAALKTGNLDELNAYPSLRPTLQKLLALQQAGQLNQYRPAQSSTPSIGSVATQSLTGTVGVQSLSPSEQGAYADQFQAIQRTPGTSST